jgi:hypothetical protein
MVLKIFKALWFLSVLVVLANLLYVYASLPESVVIQEESTGAIIANREFLFYVLTALLLVVNVMVYIIGKMFESNEDFRSWFYGLIITMNIFFVFAMNLIQVYNSSENFDYSRIGFIIYGSVGLVVLWAVSWPVYVIYRKLFVKHEVSQQYLNDL